MKVRCAVSFCLNKVDIPWYIVIYNLWRSGGKDKNLDTYCPKHKEFLTHGKYDDKDPNTNSEFNKSRE